MTRSISASDNVTTSTRQKVRVIASWAPAIVFGAALGLFAIHAIIYAPAMWAAAERLKAEQIDQENKLFCEKFGMKHGTDAFATCAGYLAEIRKRHADRLTAEAAGLL